MNSFDMYNRINNINYNIQIFIKKKLKLKITKYSY